MKVEWTAVREARLEAEEAYWIACEWRDGERRGCRGDVAWWDGISWTGLCPSNGDEYITHCCHIERPALAPDGLPWGEREPEPVIPPPVPPSTGGTPPSPPAGQGTGLGGAFDMLGPHYMHWCPGPWAPWPVATLVDVDVTGTVELRHRCGPRTLFVWRETGLDSRADELVREGRAGAKRWWDVKRDRLRMVAREAGPIVIQGLNEFGGDLAAFAVFEAERLRILHDNGIFGAFGGFSVGNPREDAWGKALSPILEAASLGDVRIAHAYWTFRRTMVNPWWFMRWQLERDATPELRRWRLVLSEIGRDRIEDVNVPRADWGKRGWRRTCGLGTFVRDLEVANEMLRPYGPEGTGEVLGATPFTGGNAVGNGWCDFDCGEVYKAMWG